jgi:hypothetical protein
MRLRSHAREHTTRAEGTRTVQAAWGARLPGHGLGQGHARAQPGARPRALGAGRDRGGLKRGRGTVRAQGGLGRGTRPRGARARPRDSAGTGRGSAGAGLAGGRDAGKFRSGQDSPGGATRGVARLG